LKKIDGCAGDRQLRLPDGNDLKNPVNDATDLGAKLKGYGFDVTVALDCTTKDMDKHLKTFRKLLGTHEVALFVNRRPTLTPIDAVASL
jgi:hypothetical protein